MAGVSSLAPVFASVACEKLAVRGNVPHGLGRVSPRQFHVVSVAGASGVVDPPGKSRFVASTCVATGLRRSTEGVLRRLVPITSVYLGSCQLFSCILCDRSAFLYRSGCVEPQSRCRDVTRLYTKALVSCMKPALLSTSRSKFASLIRRPGFRDALATMILGLTPHFHGGGKKKSPFRWSVPRGIYHRGISPKMLFLWERCFWTKTLDNWTNGQLNPKLFLVQGRDPFLKTFGFYCPIVQSSIGLSNVTPHQKGVVSSKN